MGCDIHFYAEKRNVDTGKWELIGEAQREDLGDGDVDIFHEGLSFYNGRNYDLFAILADVRNGHGFAGIKTGGGFVPIAEPRGIPEDASEDCRLLCEHYGVDGHSHSYHTLRQLLDYDWTQTTSKQGWCSFREWSRWFKGEGRGPSSYSGDVFGGGVEKIEASAMDDLVQQWRRLPHGERDEFAKQHANKHALAEWDTPYFIAADEFLSVTVPKLLAEVGGTAGLDDIRIVFFFDN